MTRVSPNRRRLAVLLSLGLLGSLKACSSVHQRDDDIITRVPVPARVLSDSKTIFCNDDALIVDEYRCFGRRHTEYSAVNG